MTEIDRWTTASSNCLGYDPEAGELVKYEDHLAFVGTLTADKARLRQALVGLIGAETREELIQMELAIRLMPMPDADKAISINAIQVLLET